MLADSFPQKVPWSNPNEIHASGRQEENRNRTPKDVVILEDSDEVHGVRHERGRNRPRHHEASTPDRPPHRHSVDGLTYASQPCMYAYPRSIC